MRYGNEFTVYVDGVKGSTITSANAVGDPANKFYIGSYRGANPMYHGYIDDFRVSIGVARYTATFIHPIYTLAPTA